ncbi:hypothetical protein BN59_03430 [Legionella massiliensis]|uniref:Uncharacterized protein n=1 Tax=Legionella massiliensis TaxID=1034943 RepID=A0A078L5B1_9GAMM|nr:hypothetical protein [Legionella massiliensis]CDZ79113.1 hypothetical protein BN59_03430 [Legionella massiliensis]CEE14851.1 hypothetical protein BN1094_03430 [Legionella massiliensis]
MLTSKAVFPFFSSSKKLANSKGINLAKWKFTTFTRYGMETTLSEYRLAASSSLNGNIIRIIFPKAYDHHAAQTHIKSIIKPFKDCLVIGTTPSKRLKKDYLISIEPGHNFCFAIDKDGLIKDLISKRPNTDKKPLATRARVPDPRYGDYAARIRIFAPRFSQSIDEDINKASQASSPLFLHIIPFQHELGINQSTYSSNAKLIIEQNSPYSLMSTIHPEYGYYLRSSNCNHAVEGAVFGMESVNDSENANYDLSCQEVAIKIGAKFALSKNEYMELIEFLGLSSGIEPGKANQEEYLPLFTC